MPFWSLAVPLAMGQRFRRKTWPPNRYITVSPNSAVTFLFDTGELFVASLEDQIVNDWEPYTDV